MSKTADVISTLTPMARLVLDKMKDEDARDLMKAGEYKFSFKLQIEGTCKIGQDYWQTCWHKIRPLVILQYALNKLNANCRDTVLEEAFDWYTKITEEEKEKIDEEISASLKKIEENLKKKTVDEKKKLDEKLEQLEKDKTPNIKDAVKTEVNDMKCWGIEQYRGRVTFPEFSIKQL
jgi:hypothetical protein